MFKILFLTIVSFLIFCINTNNSDELKIPAHIPQTTLNINYETYLEISKSNYLTHWFATTLITDSCNYEAKIRIQGGISKHALKKSYKLTVYKGYPAEKSFNRILSAQFSDATLCRLRLGMYLFQKAGFYCPEIKTTHLFFDDWFQGIYLEVEPIDEFFFLKRDLPVTSFYFSHPHARFSLKNGYTPENVFEKELPKNSSSYNDLYKLFEAVENGLSNGDTTELAKILDIRNALDYYTISVLIRHSDGITNNLALYFNSEIQKFQFIPWDLTASFTGINTLTSPGPEGYLNNLFDQMIKIEVWNRYCQNRARELFNISELINLVDQYSNEIKESLLIDPTYPLTESQFEIETDRLKTFISDWNTIFSKDSIYFEAPTL